MNYKNYKTCFTILELFDTIVIIATTSRSFASYVTSIGFIAIKISIARACGLSIGEKVRYERDMQN